MRPENYVPDLKAQLIQQSYVWDGDQWNGCASIFFIFERALKNKASVSHIDYLLEPGYMTTIMYQPGYLFCDKSFIKTGGLSGVQVCHNNCILKAMIISGTVTNAQTITAFDHMSGVHILCN